jgi:hypothetical protein
MIKFHGYCNGAIYFMYPEKIYNDLESKYTDLKKK